MTHAIRIHRTGGPEVLSYEEVDVPEPGPGEVRVRHGAVGLNFIDTYHRSGLYPVKLPSGLGVEAAGTIESVGPGVDGFRAGDRVGYAGGPPGAYSQARVIAADRLVPLPDGVDDRTAAAILLKGMTAEYLVRRTFPVKPGDRVLFHAAAGGTGLLACQWAAHLGATVIGTVSTRAKAELAKAHGCAHVVVTSEEDFVSRVHELTGGAGCHVVYDGVGRDTFMKSLECLAPRGMLVSFGQASGAVPPFDPLVLSKGACYLTRPTLFVYNAKREDLLASAKALFDVVLAGAVKPESPRTYALADAARAHADLEGRRTTGSCVLLP